MVSAVRATRPAARLTIASSASDSRLTESVRKYAPNFRASVAIDVAIESRAIFFVAFIAIQFFAYHQSMIRTGPIQARRQALPHYATGARRRWNHRPTRAGRKTYFILDRSLIVLRATMKAPRPR